MIKNLLRGLVALAILTPIWAYSASDREYLNFIERNGAIVLETYRLPENSDLSYWGTDRDAQVYKSVDLDADYKAPYWTKGEFNSDDQPDYLYIVFHRSRNYGLLIGFISSESGYDIVAIEPSSKNMVVETDGKIARHFSLDGKRSDLTWDAEKRHFNLAQ